jgi:hypothetical protein
MFLLPLSWIVKNKRAFRLVCENVHYRKCLFQALQCNTTINTISNLDPFVDFSSVPDNQDLMEEFLKDLLQPRHQVPSRRRRRLRQGSKEKINVCHVTLRLSHSNYHDRKIWMACKKRLKSARINKFA